MSGLPDEIIAPDGAALLPTRERDHAIVWRTREEIYAGAQCQLQPSTLALLREEQVSAAFADRRRFLRVWG